MLKYILFFIIIFFSGCQNNHHDVKVFGDQNRVSKQFSAYISNQDKKAKEEKILEDKIKLKQLEVDAKLKAEKIKAQKDIEVAKITSNTSKEIAKVNKSTKIETTKIDAQALKEKTKIIMYISIAFGVIVIIAIIVFYLNSKKNRELKEKLHQQEMIQKQKELEEKRLHKMLDLIADGKVSKDIEKEVLLTMTKSNIKLLS